MPAKRALPSESSPTLPQDYAGGQHRGSGGDPKMILLVTFIDWAKLIFCDARTHERTHGQTDMHTWA